MSQDKNLEITFSYLTTQMPTTTRQIRVKRIGIRSWKRKLINLADKSCLQPLFYNEMDFPPHLDTLQAKRLAHTPTIWTQKDLKLKKLLTSLSKTGKWKFFNKICTVFLLSDDCCDLKKDILFYLQGPKKVHFNCISKKVEKIIRNLIWKVI